MRLGQTLEQVENVNHKPFKLKGFDKDRVATVSDCDGGAASAEVFGAARRQRPILQPPASQRISALAADKECSSSDPAIRATKPTVSEILIGY